MSTPRIPNQKKQYAALNKRLQRYVKLIEQLYGKYSGEVAQLAVRTGYSPQNGKIFKFADYPQTKAVIDRMLNDYVKEVSTLITRGTADEWKRSNAVQDLVARKVLKSYGVKDRFGTEYKRYFQANPQHLKAFQTRQINGMGLSRRVWDLRTQYKRELELGLSVGLERGKSANALARELKQYLKEPDRLFRRVRDSFGVLQLSSNAAAYHPGRGVYRSSFKNAQRLTRSEINMSYRTAEQARWRQFDFVVGYEIKLSYSHPQEDICDRLKGKYPKSFVWTGWHPNDLCYEIPILKTEEEFYSLDGKGSANEVTDVPQGFKDWVAENAGRISEAEKRGTQPYFIRDNKEVINNISNPGAIPTPPKAAAASPTPKPTASPTPKAPKAEQIKQSQQGIIKELTLEAARYEKKNALVDTYIKSMRDCRINGDIDGFNAEHAKLLKFIEVLRKQYTSDLAYSSEQLERFAEMETTFGIKRGKPMTLSEADEQKTNPDYSSGRKYQINCQTCAPAYVLRSQGFDVTASANTSGSVNEWVSQRHSFDIWENADGTAATPTLYRDWLKTKGYKEMSPKRYKEFYEEATTKPGIYITTIRWKGGSGAHATIVQRFTDGTLAYIEPQHYNGKSMKLDIMELCKRGTKKIPSNDKRGIMRVDDKLLKKKCTHNGKDYNIWSIFRTK